MSKFSCILLIALVSAMGSVSAEFVEQVARVSSRGISVYLPARREYLQEQIDYFKDRFGGPELHLPEDPIFANQPEGTHPILVDIGNVVFDDFVESEAANPDNASVSTEGVEVFLSIPFLADTPGGQNSYNLGLMVFYDDTREDFPKPDFIQAYIPADEIALDDSGLILAFGGGELRINFDRVEECNGEAWSSDDSSTELNEGGLQISMFPLKTISENYGLCQMYPYDNQFCSILDSIALGLQGHIPNVCIAWNSEEEEFCETSAEIETISGIFERLLLGYEEGTKPIFVEQYEGEYVIGAKIPCI